MNHLYKTITTASLVADATVIQRGEYLLQNRDHATRWGHLGLLLKNKIPCNLFHKWDKCIRHHIIIPKY